MPGHTEAGPEIAPGVPASGDTLANAVADDEVPQALEAVTLIVPDVPGVATIEAEVLLPVHPGGSVHV